MSLDTYNEHNPNNPINQIEVEIEEEETELEEAIRMQKLFKRILDYKIAQLRKLAEIEGSFMIFGYLTYEEKTEKNEILKQYGL